MRIKATSGSKSFQIDFAGRIIGAPPPFEEFQRSLMLEFELQGSYNSTLGNWLQAELVDDVASL